MPESLKNNQSQPEQTFQVTNEPVANWDNMFDQQAYQNIVNQAESAARMTDPGVVGVGAQWAANLPETGAGAGSASANAEVGAAAEKAEGLGSEKLDAWFETVKGTPEEYWQRLAQQERTQGVEIGEKPNLSEVDQAIDNFLDKGVKDLSEEGKAVRKEMAQKAILKDLVELSRGGVELNDMMKRNIFYSTQQMLERIYRENPTISMEAKGGALLPDEKVAWHLKMEPRAAKLNTLLALNQHARRPGESDDAYEARVRNYAEDTLEHVQQKEQDAEYVAAQAEEMAQLTVKTEELPEFTYLQWEDVHVTPEEQSAKEEAARQEEFKQKLADLAAEAEANPGRWMSDEERAEMAQQKTAENTAENTVEGRENRVKQLFEKVRGRLGFQKVVEKVVDTWNKVKTGIANGMANVAAEDVNVESGVNVQDASVKAENVGAQIADAQNTDATKVNLAENLTSAGGSFSVNVMPDKDLSGNFAEIDENEAGNDTETAEANNRVENGAESNVENIEQRLAQAERGQQALMNLLMTNSSDIERQTRNARRLFMLNLKIAELRAERDLAMRTTSVAETAETGMNAAAESNNIINSTAQTEMRAGTEGEVEAAA